MGKLVQVCPTLLLNIIKNDTYDIRGGYNNMMLVIKALFPGVDNLDVLAENLGKYEEKKIKLTIDKKELIDDSSIQDKTGDVHIAIEKESTNGGMKTIGMNWHFFPNHYQLEFDTVKEPKDLFNKEKYQILLSGFKISPFGLAVLLAPNSLSYKELEDKDYLKNNLVRFYILPLDNNEKITDLVKHILSQRPQVQKTGDEIKTENALIVKLSKEIERVYEVFEDFLNQIDHSWKNNELIQSILCAQDDQFGAQFILTKILQGSIDATEENLKKISTDRIFHLIEIFMEEYDRSNILPLIINLLYNLSQRDLGNLINVGQNWLKPIRMIEKISLFQIPFDDQENDLLVKIIGNFIKNMHFNNMDEDTKKEFYTYMTHIIINLFIVQQITEKDTRIKLFNVISEAINVLINKSSKQEFSKFLQNMDIHEKINLIDKIFDMQLPTDERLKLFNALIDELSKPESLKFLQNMHNHEKKRLIDDIFNMQLPTGERLKLFNALINELSKPEP